MFTSEKNTIASYIWIDPPVRRGHNDPRMKTPITVTVTGAAGNIAYSLLFRIAAGEMLGADQPVVLKLLEITPCLDKLHGVVMAG